MSSNADDVPRAPSAIGARRAFELAVGALGRKERTLHEMREWLAERVDDPADAEAAVQKLLGMGELDDSRFAELFAEDKRELSGWGPERIRETLVARGVDRGIATDAVSGEPRDQQIDRAVAVLRTRSFDASSESGRGKALGLLARRGYDSETAYAAVRAVERDAA